MKFKRTIVTALAASALVVSAAAPAMAVRIEVSGGTWSYGVNNSEGGTVWSNFYHEDDKHRSSVENGYGDYYNSGCVAADKWYYASLKSHPSETDRSYYAVDDCN